mmetsp:Transcript_8763/g.12022  ORF Transcript_8763/g.12022 Transcript_8763/m.12022 type:complete len:403 (-) Transcript_8763:296-1504(-)
MVLSRQLVEMGLNSLVAIGVLDDDLLFLDTDGRLHQTRQGGEHIDGRVDLPVVQGVVDKDLTLSDVASQVGNGMGDIRVGHRQDGQLSDGTVGAADTAGALIDSGEIGVHVTRVTTTAWDFFTGGRDLTEGVRVRRHISKDGQHVHLLSVGQVLGGSEGETGRDDTLDGRIVGEVHEEDDTVHGAVHLEVSLEEAGSLHVDTHGSEHDDEVLFGVILHILVLHEGGLATNLGTNGVMRETGGGEERDLLTTGDGVHDIDGGDTSLDHLLGVVSLERINRLTLDVEEALGEHGRTVIDRDALTVELATKHLGRDGHFEHIAGELAVRVRVVDVGSALEDLHDGLLAGDLENLTLPDLTVAKLDVDDLRISKRQGKQVSTRMVAGDFISGLAGGGRPAELTWGT